MSYRALLAIGCNEYSELGPLRGAEADARAIFDSLMKPGAGDYDVNRSNILLSPLLSEVRGALKNILFDNGRLDTLTISFAGHGGIAGGSFYMAMRDSRLGALSATALSLADLLRMIAEAAPRQTYIIIDACQSGGVISDLGVILKSETMGRFGTPGVTILATAASDQAAVEMAGHGVGTLAILACINGDEFIQDSSPALDLVEIGRVVSERVSSAGGQVPVVWGLNLYGPAGFCKNPHSGMGNAPLRSVLDGWQDFQVVASLRSAMRSLWEPYVSIGSKWDARLFCTALEAVLNSFDERGEVARVDLIRRIGVACAAQASESNDQFREIEVRAACIVAMLPYSGSIEVDEYLSEACEEVAILAKSALERAVEAVGRYQYALVTGGLADLYYLPVRLTKLLGWAGYVVHCQKDLNNLMDLKCFVESIFSKIFENYPVALVSVSDSQAPFVVSIATAAFHLGLHEQAERMLGHLFMTAGDCGAQVAKADIDSGQVLHYLMCRHSGGTIEADLVARPTELVLAIMRLSRLFDLDEEFDLDLADLDHVSLLGYLPSEFSNFGGEHVPGGTNVIFTIGQDVWTVSDIEKLWPLTVTKESTGVRLSALLACLLFPDRTPWFLLDEIIFSRTCATG
jgi:hypothetical protein